MTRTNAPAAGDTLRPQVNWEQLPPHLAAWQPGVRTIRKPFAFGQRADGTPKDFAIWLPSHGALHPLMGGATGGGKTNTLNVLTLGIVSCADTVLWYIDVAKKGQAAAPWARCIDWIARDRTEAVAMLTAAVRIIEARSDRLARDAALEGTTDKILPSPRQPHLIIIIDEAAAAFGITSGDDAEICMIATELATQIAQTGRSAAVSLLVATQRPTVASLGNNGDFRAQLFPNICLRMRERRDTTFALTNVDLDLIDATQLNRAGLLYMQDFDGAVPIPIRSYALYLPPAVRALSKLYAPYRPQLEAAAIQAADAPYARRPIDPFGVLTTTTTTAAAARSASAPAAPAAAPAAEATSPRPQRGTVRPRPSSTEPGSEPTQADSTAKLSVLRIARAAVADARAVVTAGETLPELPRIPVSELATHHDAQPAPAEPGDGEKCAAILAVLDEAPAQGMTAVEIQKTVNTAGTRLSRAHAYRLLRVLTDAGEAHQTGAKGKYRYHRGPDPATQTQAA